MNVAPIRPHPEYPEGDEYEHMMHLFATGKESAANHLHEMAGPNPRFVEKFLSMLFDAQPSGVRLPPPPLPLTDALEWARWMLCGGCPHEVLAHLHVSATSAACGRVWKSGEAAYKCRTCEMDPTCAICVPCFNAGCHRGHDYMLIRTGGGCCDCGDPQAWRREGFCSRHRGHSEEEDPSAFLPSSLRQACIPVLSAVVFKLVDCVRRLDDGRAASIELADWLKSLACQGDGFRHVLGGVFTTSHVPTDSERVPLDDLMELETLLSLSVASSLHSLFYELLMVPSFKPSFLEAFMRHYHTFVMNCLDNHPYNGGILHEFSVQVLTVPNVAPNKVFTKGLLDILLSTLHSVFARTLKQRSTGDTRVVDVSHSIFEHEERRVDPRVLVDLKYVFTHVPVCQFLLFKAPHLMASWVQFLSHLEGMNPNIRVSDAHVVYESTLWIRAISLERDVMNCLPRILDGFRAGENKITCDMSLEEATRPCPLTPSLRQSIQEVVSHCTQALASSSLSIIHLRRHLDLNVENEPISFHIPLHRTLTALLLEAMKQWNLPPQEALRMDQLPNGFLENLVEHPLRIQVLLSQVRAGMWRRNGHTVMTGQCVNYKGVILSEVAFNLDLALLQILSILLGPEWFLRHALRRFNLEVYFNVKTTHETSAEEKVIAGDFLHFIATIAKERCSLGMSTEERIRRDIVHRLILGDRTHSQLTRSIPQDLVEHPQFEQILREVSTYTHPKTLDQGKYRLRPEFFCEYDPFFPHYNTPDAQKAEERIQLHCKTTGAPLPLGWSHLGRTYSAVAASLPAILHCHILLQIIFSVLYNYFHDTGNVSEVSFVTCLQLLLLALETPLSEEVRQELTLCPPGPGATAHPTSSSSSPPVSPPPTSPSLRAQALNRLHELLSPSDKSPPDFASRFDLLSNMIQEIPVATGKASILSLLMDIYPQSRLSPDQRTMLCCILRSITNRNQEAKGIVDSVLTIPQTVGDSLSEQRRRDVRARQASILATFQRQQRAFHQDGEFHLPEEGERREEVVCVLCREAATGPDDKRPLGHVAFIQGTRIVAMAQQQVLKGEVIPKLVALSDGNNNNNNNDDDGDGDSDDDGGAEETEGTEEEETEEGEMDNRGDDEYSVSEDGTEGWEMATDDPDDNTIMDLLAHPRTGDDEEVDSVHDEREEEEENREGVRVDWNVDTDPILNALPCGHAMHFDCFDRYFSTLVHQHIIIRSFYDGSIVDLNKGEFLCPLCRRIANALIPIVPHELVMQSQMDSDAKYALKGLLSLPEKPLDPTSVGALDPVLSLLVSRAFRGRQSTRSVVAPPDDYQAISELWCLLIGVVACRELAFRLSDITSLLAPETLVRECISGLWRAAVLFGHSSWQREAFCRLVVRHEMNRMAHRKDTELENSDDVPTDMIPPLTTTSFLSTDMFGWCVRMLCATSIQIPSCLVHDLVLVAYAVTVLQALLHLVLEEEEGTRMPPRPSGSSFLDQKYESMRRSAGRRTSPDTHKEEEPSLASLVQEQCLVFLRRMALFVTCCDLAHGTTTPVSQTEQVVNTSAQLLSYLSLPPPEELCNEDSEVSDLIEAWSRQLLLCLEHRCTEESKPPPRPGRVLVPPQPFHLIKLPLIFQELYEMFLTARCSRCETVPEHPALCLCCGTLVCLGTACCKRDRMGEAFQHAQTCGGGIGMFLLSSSVILCIRENRRSLWGSPYLDEHGEEDLELRRGRPLLLDPSRYAYLTHMMTTQSFDHDSRILEMTRRDAHIL